MRFWYGRYAWTSTSLPPERLVAAISLAIELDPARNDAVRGERSLYAASCRLRLKVLRTDREWIVSSPTFELLTG